jgi:beta-glucosidase
LASYDSNCIKTANGGYILEAGDYSISVRSDSHTVLDEESFHVDTDMDYSTQGRESDDIEAVNQFQDYAAGNVTYLSRSNGFANYEEATAALADTRIPMMQLGMEMMRCWDFSLMIQIRLPIQIRLHWYWQCVRHVKTYFILLPTVEIIQ